MGKQFVYQAHQHSLLKGTFSEIENAIRATGADLDDWRYEVVRQQLMNRDATRIHFPVGNVSYSVEKIPLEDT